MKLLEGRICSGVQLHRAAASILLYKVLCVCNSILDYKTNFELFLVIINKDNVHSIKANFMSKMCKPNL